MAADALPASPFGTVVEIALASSFDCPAVVRAPYDVAPVHRAENCESLTPNSLAGDPPLSVAQPCDCSCL